MDYKEKYETLVGGIKGWLDKYVGDWQRGVFNLPFDKTGEIAKDIIKLVPELAESEDERIRKEIISFIETEACDSPISKNWLAYLEKQKEQKPAEWSEEDEKMIDKIVENLTELKERYGTSYGRVGDCIAWLESNLPVKKGLGEVDVDAMVKAFSDNLPLCGEFKTYHDALAYTYRQGIEATLNALHPNSN